MKKVVLMFLVCICLFSAPSYTPAKSTNFQIMKRLCSIQNRPILIIRGYSKKAKRILLHRKNKNYIVVEKVISRSNGKEGGYDEKGYYIAYNKKVKKNKKVISYVIYDPLSNEPDEILWVVDNHTYR